MTPAEVIGALVVLTGLWSLWHSHPYEMAAWAVFAFVVCVASWLFGSGKEDE